MPTHYKAEDVPHLPIPDRALAAIAADANLPICETCGTQYPSPRDECPICEDPREAVPARGQRWTSISTVLGPICEDPRQWVPGTGQKWTSSASATPERRNTLLKDGRLTYIKTEPGFGINQTPILFETEHGAFIWDCSAILTPQLAGYLSSLDLKAIAISHPHFFSTSLTWARALGVPLYINEDDREWYQRDSEVKDEIRWWRGREKLAPGVTLIQCGGHFPGSSVLHWDQGDGYLLTADTVMVQMSQRAFTFIWSAPNMLPLNPEGVVGILKALEGVHFGFASSAWPERAIRKDARDVFVESARKFLSNMGWVVERGELRAKLQGAAYVE